MAATQSFDVGVAHQIGHYADAVPVPAGLDQILVPGTPGLAPDGTVPSDVTDEAAQAWRNVAVIPALVRPEFRVEIEVIAVRPAIDAVRER